VIALGRKARLYDKLQTASKTLGSHVTKPTLSSSQARPEHANRRGGRRIGAQRQLEAYLVFKASRMPQDRDGPFYATPLAPPSRRMNTHPSVRTLHHF
jgi:hypothetical protein